MKTNTIFNCFNTMIGLLLIICAFLMQAKIDNVCGSKPLRNSILGILLIGVVMFCLGGISLYQKLPALEKNPFAVFVGALGVTLVGLGSVIVQNSTQECSKDVVCDQTDKDKNSTPCDGARLWGGIVVAVGCLMIVGAGTYGMFASGADEAALTAVRNFAEASQNKANAKDFNQMLAKGKQEKKQQDAKRAEKNIQVFQKTKAQEIAATGVRPTDAQLLGGRGNLKKTSKA